MIARHPLAAAAAAMYAVIVVSFSIGISAGWSNEALGWAMVGAAVVAAVVRVFADGSRDN